MAFTRKFFLAFLAILSMASVVMPRPVLKNTAPVTASATPLATRLKLLDGKSTKESAANCWDSLFELQSCTGEVILFFLNGETYLGPHCCRAIRVIEHHCWPAMLGSLGFTAEEGDILVGFCDASESNPLPLESPPPPNAYVLDSETTAFSHELFH